MRKLLLLCLLTMSISINAQEYPFQNPKLTTQQRVEDLISRMTLEEKIDLLAGYEDFYLHPCERLGIPAFKLADGPLGLSSWGLFGRATAFPSALSLAASWNPELVAQVGAMYAQEWRARGIHFLLAPGVNNYRASKGARNFEYFGEDPFLASELVVPFIQGVQNGGVIATVKHFAANDQEFDRYTVSTEVSERSLREIYLPPFKAAVQKAGVKAVMTGYNLVNGVYCTQNDYLNNTILKGEWGFKGILMSDWACTHSAVGAANGGLDLEMGSNDWFNREQLLPLIESGKISKETIDEKIRRVYGACIEMGFFDRPQHDTTIPTFNPKANKMSLDGAREGIILLKNDKNILPLKSPKTIAVIGPTANPTVVSDRVYSVNGIVYGGGGSSKVNPWYVVNDLQGIQREFPEATVLYDEGISNRFKSLLFRKGGFVTRDGKPGLDAKYYNMSGPSTTPSAQDNMLEKQAKAAGRTDVLNSLTTGETEAPAQAEGNMVKSQVDRTVNFEWWGKPHNLQSIGDDYIVRWDGYVDVKKSDDLLFFVDAQGGYRLWLDGKLVLDASESQSFDVRNSAITVQKGDKVHVELEFNNQRSLPAEIRMGYTYKKEIDFSESLRLAKTADVVVFCGGLDGAIELEGRDRPFELPYGQDMLIKEIAKVNPNIVVAIHAGGGIDMTPWIAQVPGVIHALYAGQEGGTALAEVLSGKVNPSAKLPFTIEKQWSDSPACGNYDETRREKKVYYNEGIFTGYRGYDKKEIEPLFPFGYGLSYSSFEYSDLKVEKIGKTDFEATFTITNTGKLAGAEVAQLYVRDPKSAEERPLKELKGFGKYKLAPGESVRATIKLNSDSFAYFSDKKRDWVVEPGAFEIWVGSSSKDIRLKESIKIN